MERANALGSLERGRVLDAPLAGGATQLCDRAVLVLDEPIAHLSLDDSGLGT
jgi:hypothetical protein